MHRLRGRCLSRGCIPEWWRIAAGSDESGLFASLAKALAIREETFPFSLPWLNMSFLNSCCRESLVLN